MNGEVPSKSRFRKKYRSNFLESLFDILESNNFASHIGWCENNQSFYVLNPNEFANIVLPQFFKHKNFTSFTRQLNMYNFTRTNNSKTRITFTHSMFVKDRRDLALKINRRRVHVNSLPNRQGAFEKEVDELSSNDLEEYYLSEPQNSCTKRIKTSNESEPSPFRSLNEPSFRDTSPLQTSTSESSLFSGSLFDQLSDTSSPFGTKGLLNSIDSNSINLSNPVSRASYPIGFSEFKAGLEIYLKFDEIEKAIESKFKKMLDLNFLLDDYTDYIFKNS